MKNKLKTKKTQKSFPILTKKQYSVLKNYDTSLANFSGIPKNNYEELFVNNTLNNNGQLSMEVIRYIYNITKPTENSEKKSISEKIDPSDMPTPKKNSISPKNKIKNSQINNHDSDISTQLNKTNLNQNQISQIVDDIIFKSKLFKDIPRRLQKKFKRSCLNAAKIKTIPKNFNKTKNKNNNNQIVSAMSDSIISEKNTNNNNDFNRQQKKLRSYSQKIKNICSDFEDQIDPIDENKEKTKKIITPDKSSSKAKIKDENITEEEYFNKKSKSEKMRINYKQNTNINTISLIQNEIISPPEKNNNISFNNNNNSQVKNFLNKKRKFSGENFNNNNNIANNNVNNTNNGNFSSNMPLIKNSLSPIFSNNIISSYFGQQSNMNSPLMLNSPMMGNSGLVNDNYNFFNFFEGNNNNHINNYSVFNKFGNNNNMNMNALNKNMNNTFLGNDSDLHSFMDTFSKNNERYSDNND